VDGILSSTFALLKEEQDYGCTVFSLETWYSV